MGLPDDTLETLERFTLGLADAAADVILPRFRSVSAVEDKGPSKNGGFDPVTEADRGAEAAIRALIGARFPDHGVIGEEYGSDRPDADFVWVLDPIDGTRAFISGLPVWTTLVALRCEGRPLIGAIAQGYLGEVFLGSPRGATLIRNGARKSLACRPCAGLADALAATTDPYLFKDAEAERFSRLRARARLTRYGCDAYAYAMVAEGCLDLVVETGLKCWDIEAAVPVLKGAGGLITDWEGRDVGPAGGRLLIAGDPRAHAEAVGLLSADAA